jgi:hypothetical protein
MYIEIDANAGNGILVNVCMYVQYVCIHVCMYVQYVCIHVYMYVQYVCMYSMYAYMYACMYVCMYIYDDYHVREVPDFAASPVPAQPSCSRGIPIYVCMYVCSGKYA